MAHSGPKIEIEIALEARAELGECPVWDARDQALYFVDCRRPALFRFEPASGALREWTLPAPIGCFALTEPGGAVLALASGIARFDFASGAAEPPAHPEPGRPAMLFNDGGVDPAGRLWAGTMHRSYREPAGAIWRFGPEPRAVFRGLKVPNGLAWSAEGTRFYFSDSPRAMFAAAYDAASGAAEPPYVFATEAAAPGWPDGTAIDAEDFLWNARWDGGGVARFAPDGRLDRFIALPVSRPTSCCFGGPGLDLLYVTSARAALDAIAAEPLAGAVFALRVGVRGLPPRRATVFPREKP